MIRRGKAILFALLALALVIPAHGADMPTTFLDTHYYILSLGTMSVDLPTLVQTAQAAGHSIIQFDDSVASITRNGEATDNDLAIALADDSVLLIDADRFYLRQVSESYAFTVRPTDGGYELIVSPAEEISVNETLAAVLTGLQQIGILGNEVNLDFASFAKADLKGPSAPLGVPIDSTLYGLVVAEDWFVYATIKAIPQVGLRVEIVAEMIPGTVLAEEFEAYVVEESTSLTQLLLPIDQLLALAQSTSVGYVRLAYLPSVP